MQNLFRGKENFKTDPRANIFSNYVFSGSFFPDYVFSNLVFSNDAFPNCAFSNTVFSDPVFSDHVMSCGKPVFSVPIFRKPMSNQSSGFVHSILFHLFCETFHVDTTCNFVTNKSTKIKKIKKTSHHST